MKVLLKNKVKRKGQPKYDPKPYTITELHGRQAVLQRGDRKIRRETQKFKRFYEPRPATVTRTDPRPADDWEDSWRNTDRTARKQGTDSNVLTAPHSDNSVPQTTATLTDQEPVPETNNEASQYADQASQTPAGDNNQATDSRRTSNRERRARDMYGDWDTS